MLAAMTLVGRGSGSGHIRAANSRITAIVTDTIINEGFESVTEVLGGRSINFVVLRPPVGVLRQRGIERLPEAAVYLAQRVGSATVIGCGVGVS
jgi:hypothetical protein